LNSKKRTEKAREEIEEVLLELKTKYNDLMNTNTKSQAKIKDLQTEVKNLSRKLKEAEDCLFSYTRKYNDHHVLLQNIYDKVSPVFRRERERERDRGEKKNDERDRKDRDNSNNERSVSSTRVDTKVDVKEESVKSEVKNEDNISEAKDEVKDEKITE